MQVTYLSLEHSITSNGIVLVTIPANKCKCLRERERESLIIFNARLIKLKYLNSPFGCNEWQSLDKRCNNVNDLQTYL